ncbi:sensor histidine kinase regulating citrate/malate metabolism [Paenibacillus phyllosphaerae]|uniref:Sensor histidine kinase regulating citrate/malate metabolism n=1 Tax=Paenibacillus phyllosphaerae TaxID=274593 RepID=A0A7W5AT22_9BACL|nr:ATP-binding protein [Paenibacillus phyllosphaerae]MBB3108275.1 sensor histidine kinase regulating citrate/malate metabolism [Paenibacillus phyllosphaerae]
MSVIQFVLLGYYFGMQTFGFKRQAAGIVLYISLVLILLIFIVTIRLITRTRIEAIQSTQKAYIDELNQMFTTVRGQRHDFINHVQVMHAMLTMKKYDQLRDYMNDVAQEIRAVDQAHVEHPSPALAALIEAKIAIASKRQIPFEYRIDEAPATFGAVTSIDLVRMIGNLIDNAFDASADAPAGERYVLLEMAVSRGMLHISVTNRGTVLSEAQRRAMVLPGYTTKTGEHSGLGLTNVMDRAAQYRGKVTIESDEERGVVITVKLPESGKPANRVIESQFG